MPVWVTDPVMLQAELVQDLADAEAALERLHRAVPVSAEAAKRRAATVLRAERSVADLRALLERSA